MISKKHKRGMTLIELLVSLSIIAIMAGVAMPIFSNYQRSSALDNDAQAVAQMFSYARALQNNPDIATRNKDESYVLKISQTSGSKKIKIYSKTAPESIIDQYILNSSKEVSISTNSGSVSDDDFLVTFSGRSPADVITCDPKTCSQTLAIKIYLSRDHSVFRTIQIQNTYPVDHPTQYFSITTSNE